jgi:multimeric flavodoxin WrbA
MNAVILDGSSVEGVLNNTGKILDLELKNKRWNVESYELSKEKIATCTGCYGCWLKTPGQCIIRDKGQEIAEKVIKSDLLILLSPVTFGGYSFHLKKVVDRLIPNILPFFTKIDGELHHKPRYKKNPKILAVGYLPRHDEESEKIFTKLVSRNAINMHSPENHTEIVTDDEADWNDFKVNSMFEKVDVIL